MKFKLLEDSKEIECNIVMTFTDDTNGISYIAYTDGTKDGNGELEIYASRYQKDGENFRLEEIKNDYEWNLIDNMLGAGE